MREGERERERERDPADRELLKLSLLLGDALLLAVQFLLNARRLLLQLALGACEKGGGNKLHYIFYYTAVLCLSSRVLGAGAENSLRVCKFAVGRVIINKL